MNTGHDNYPEFYVANPWFLLEIAEDANPPDFTDEHYTGIHSFAATGGWLVGFYYDDSELDCIEYFVTPKGHRITIWGGEHNVELIERNAILQRWEAVGDLARMKSESGLIASDMRPMAGLFFSHGFSAIILGAFLWWLGDAINTNKMHLFGVLLVFFAACLFDLWRDLKKGRRP